MKKRFSDEQIISILCETEAGGARRTGWKNIEMCCNAGNRMTAPGKQFECF